MDVGSLIVRGVLEWDTASDGLELKAGFVVAENGAIKIGTSLGPMLKRATIYIKNNGRTHSLGKRIFGGMFDFSSRDGNPMVSVHGRPLARTWSLLVETTAIGATSIRVEGDLISRDPTLPGGGAWRVGDRIGVAPTGMPSQGHGDFAGESFRITAMRVVKSGAEVATVIDLDAPLEEPKLGVVSKRLQAEVINLERNIVITGDDFDDELHGLQTKMAYGMLARDQGRQEELGGTMHIEYTRVEKCGQRGILGSYCLHFHLMGDCTAGSDGQRCIFRGNAVENSQQRGITIHGTHHSLVDQNVLWWVRGAGIYIEDGNEMGNVIRENVNICPDRGSPRLNCRALGTDNDHADNGHQSGIWSLSATNDFLYNRMVGHEHGFFLQTNAFPDGKGAARGKVCTLHSPLGRFVGNVHHSNSRFGFYLDSNFPRRLRRSVASNGFVEDIGAKFDGNPKTWNSCEEFTADGRDNGAPGVVEDGFDWANNFVGQYGLSDVQYLRYHSINNMHGLYWKSTKKFATAEDIGLDTWHTGSSIMSAASPLPVAHVKDSTFEFISDHDIVKIMKSPYNGIASILGPGGLGAFIVEKTRFIGRVGAGHVSSNQHCDVGGTGALCTPEYQLVDVDFSESAPNTKWIQFGISSGDSELPSYSTFDSTSLAGYAGAASRSQSHLLDLIDTKTGLPICRWAADVGLERQLDGGILCDRQLRRLQLWSAEQANGPPYLRLDGDSGNTLQDMKFIGGMYGKHGYGVVVMPGFSYSLYNLEALPGNVDRKLPTMEFSDPIYGTHFGQHDSLSLTLVVGLEAFTCSTTSQHDRLFISPTGPKKSGQGACLAPTSIGTLADIPTTSTTTTTPWCFAELAGLAADEGAGLGTGSALSIVSCQESCAKNSKCRSISYCPQVPGCWLKSKVINASEPTRVRVNELCVTHFKTACGIGHSTEPAVSSTLATTRQGSITPALATTRRGSITTIAPVTEGCRSRGFQPGFVDKVCRAGGPDLTSARGLGCHGETLTGTSLRVDWHVHYCKDCAERCFFQVWSECAGFNFVAYDGDSELGFCTYFSQVTGVIPSGPKSIAFFRSSVDLPIATTTTSAIAPKPTRRPTTHPTLKPTRRPTTHPTPTLTPSQVPTTSPTQVPTSPPTSGPTPAPTMQPTLAPTQAFACEDSVAWTNPLGRNCEAYLQNGWCADGTFKSDREWTGKIGFQDGNVCQDHADCGEKWNYPSQNCVACGKTCEEAPCEDTAGWTNPVNKNCQDYFQNGWCLGGTFKSDREWTGKIDFQDGNVCKDHADCGEKWNYPSRNCLVCGKTCAEVVEGEMVEGDLDERTTHPTPTPTRRPTTHPTLKPTLRPTTYPTPMPTANPPEASLLDNFEPVDGGNNRACRGTGPNDWGHAGRDFVLEKNITSLVVCMHLCMDLPGGSCKGVEYRFADGRCELWKRDGGIGTSKLVRGIKCYRYEPLDVKTVDGFEPVDGANDRACRGAGPNDYGQFGQDFTLELYVESLRACMDLCMNDPFGLCNGIEYRSRDSRCELWKREGGIGTSKPVRGVECYRYDPRTLVPVDGAVDRTCRGASPHDTDSAYYVLEDDVANLGDCERSCRRENRCRGIEYNEGLQRCEIWTLETGIQASQRNPGYVCYRFSSPSAFPSDKFEPVDGGIDRACRGTSAQDDKPSYYTVKDNTDNWTACQQHCLEDQRCRGIEYNQHKLRCEVWTLETGIKASKGVSGFACFRLRNAVVSEPVLFTPVDGAVGRACRGSSSQDNSWRYFTKHDGTPSLLACQKHCQRDSDCKGIEYNADQQRCEVWTLETGIQVSVRNAGYVCYRRCPIFCQKNAQRFGWEQVCKNAQCQGCEDCTGGRRLSSDYSLLI
jgi:hypothetical protein